MPDSDLDFVKVVGRFALTVGDSVDGGDNPDITWCDSGTIILEPLITYTKVVGADPSPFTAGHSIITCELDAEGYLTYNGARYVWLVDLTSDKINPKIADAQATHRVIFQNVAAGELVVNFPTMLVRLEPGENDLTVVAPVASTATESIIQGPAGPNTVPTAEAIAAVDADAESLFRIQQDARHLAAILELPGPYAVAYAADSAQEDLTPTFVSYNPASLVQNTCPTDASWEDIDATNLAVTFVCPPSGKVEVELVCAVGMAVSQSLYWGLRDVGTNARHADTVMLVATSSGAAAMNATVMSRKITVSKNGVGAALIPGNRYTFVWQQRQGAITSTCYTQFGGVGNTGPAFMKVTPISNRLASKTITAAVEADPNWIPLDLAPDGLKMVGFAGSGQPSIVGRLAYSSDAGATWTALPNLVTPPGTAAAWFAGDGEVCLAVGITGSAPGKLYKSTGWATNPATATFSAKHTANNVGGTNAVYFANYAGNHPHGAISVINEYGPKTASEMARHVVVTEDHGDTWRSILDLRTFILDLVPAWDGNDAHVHGSVYDPWWDCIWVVTGDYDGAGTLPYTLVSFDWRTANPTWHIVYTKHQFTSIIPMPGCILFGTDMGSSATDGIGNGLLRLRRTTPADLTAGREAVLEAGYIKDTGSGISVIGMGFRRHRHIADAPTLIGFGESGAVGPTGRIVATYDGFNFNEIWTATDTGTTGAVGAIIGPHAGKITVQYKQAADAYSKSLTTLTIT